MQEFVVVPERRPCLLRPLPLVDCELQSLSMSEEFEFESLCEFEFEFKLSPFCASARRFILIVTFGVISFSFSLGFCFDFDFGVVLLLLFDLLLFACFGVCTSCCCCCFFFGVACFLALLFLLDLLLCLAGIAYFCAQCLNQVRV